MSASSIMIRRMHEGDALFSKR